MTFKEVERHGGYGIAKKRKKEIEEKTNAKAFVFKDLSNDPFTSFRTDQYIVAIEEHKDD